VGEEPSDVDGLQNEGEKTLNWEAAEVEKRRDHQRVTDLQRDLPKNLCSQQQMKESLP
jgi:hypothetical protein